MAQMTDGQRDTLAVALAAAIALMYRAAAREAREALNLSTHPVATPRAPNAAIRAFAVDRAQKAQNGVNSRLAAAQDADEPDDTPETRIRAMRHYNDTILVPFLASWALHQALIDTYRDTTDPASPGQSLADTAQWQWARNTDAEADECQEAADASPASLDDLLAITGAPPPVHERCQCTLTPT